MIGPLYMQTVEVKYFKAGEVLLVNPAWSCVKFFDSFSEKQGVNSRNTTLDAPRIVNLVWYDV